ncbi:MAG: hypothetical protein QOI55_1952, partial [Actinomycetota bacterium]|nr:hypothetical protein [Actinomycetota bacterium]
MSTYALRVNGIEHIVDGAGPGE